MTSNLKDNERTRLSKEKQRIFRRGLLSQFSCIACHECDPDLIDWHHVNPDEKIYSISTALTVAHDRWWNEVLKCVPLCALCHRKLHMDKLCLLPIHR